MEFSSTIIFYNNFVLFQVLIFVMFYSLFCHVDIDDNFDDSYDDEEAFVNEEDESWYTKDKMVKTKVYR